MTHVGWTPIALPAARGDAVAMDPIRVELEYWAQGAAVHGRLKHPDGPAVPFQGWLGLLTALAQASPEPAQPEGRA